MPQWTFGHLYLFELWFSPDIWPGVEFLGQSFIYWVTWQTLMNVDHSAGIRDTKVNDISFPGATHILIDKTEIWTNNYSTAWVDESMECMQEQIVGELVLGKTSWIRHHLHFLLCLEHKICTSGENKGR